MIKSLLYASISDQHAEYQRRHEKLWPEMRQMLKEHGAIKYQIFKS